MLDDLKAEYKHYAEQRPIVKDVNKLQLLIDHVEGLEIDLKNAEYYRDKAKGLLKRIIESDDTCCVCGAEADYSDFADYYDVNGCPYCETKQFIEYEKMFDIWSEGYAATGQSNGAIYHGKCRGKDLQDACERYADKNLDWGESFDSQNLTYWGCSLFDNEKEARKSFG